MRWVMVGLMLVCFCSLAPRSRGDSGQDEQLAGIWFGETVNGIQAHRLRQSVLLIRGDKLVIIAGTGVAVSRYSASQGQISIERFDGRSQPGLYQLEDGLLKLTLGDAEGVRPTHLEHKPGDIQLALPRHAHYRFTRSPTRRGLEVLSDALQDPKVVESMMEEAEIGLVKLGR